MTFLQVVNIIRDTALAQPNVNTVVREFLDLNREDTKYSAVVIQDRDGLRDRIVEQDWNTFTFHLGYVDRLTFDESNRDDIFSTGINVINNIVASIRERWDLEVSIIDRFSTFNQRFTANCAGVYVVLAIQIPVSDCVDTEEMDIYDKLSIDITDNGHYHYIPEGRPYGDIDITVSVENQKPEDKLEEIITSNGSYHFEPENGRVFSEADITVSVPGKPEDKLEESITSNGSYHYEPLEGRVFSEADINVDVHPTRDLYDIITFNSEYQWPGEWRSVRLAVEVHPSNKLVETITANGKTSFSGEWKDAEITVAVSAAKPEESLVETITSNGSYYFEPDPGKVYSSASIDVNVHPSMYLMETIKTNGTTTYYGEWTNAVIYTDVHPSTSFISRYDSNGIYNIFGEFNGGVISVAVPSDQKLEERLIETITSNGSYNFSPASGKVYSSADIDVNVHPSTSLVRSFTSNGTTSLSGEWKDAEITIAVPTTLTVTMTQAQYDTLTVKDSNTIYLING